MVQHHPNKRLLIKFENLYIYKFRKLNYLFNGTKKFIGQFKKVHGTSEMLNLNEKDYHLHMIN